MEIAHELHGLPILFSALSSTLGPLVAQWDHWHACTHSVDHGVLSQVTHMGVNTLQTQTFRAADILFQTPSSEVNRDHPTLDFFFKVRVIHGGGPSWLHKAEGPQWSTWSSLHDS